MRRRFTMTQALRRAVPRTALLIVSLAAPAAFARPAYGAGTSRLAFSSMREGGDFHIYLMNPDGSDVTRVTRSVYGGDGAAISPDGSRIVFESPRRSFGELYLINVDGSNEHRVLDAEFHGESGTWSPASERIAFTHSTAPGSPAGIHTLWIVNADGSGLEQVSPAGVDDALPDWSPDGTTLAFTSYANGLGDILLMNVDGTARVQLTTGPGSKLDAAWSPDGTKIAYAHFPPPVSYTASSIHVMNADGTGDQALTDATSGNARPAWSPDGSRISFHSNRSGCFQIYTMAADGSDVQRVTWVASVPGDLNGNWRIVPTTGAPEGPATSVTLALRAAAPALTPVRIEFTVPQCGPVRLEIFDSSGRHVRSLLRGTAGAGTHVAPWDARNDSGAVCPAGVYHCRLVTASATRTVKLVLVK